MYDRESAGGRSETRVPARVLAIDTHWFSHSGGINTFNRRLCGALAAAGADVRCLVPEASPAELDHARADGVTLVSAPGAPAASALFSRPDLPIGFLPDLIIGHGRVTGPAARSQKRHFPSAVHVHVMHTSPLEYQWDKCGGKPPGQAVEEKAEAERQLAGAATIALAVGPKLLEVLRHELRSFTDRPRTGEIVPGFDGVDLELRDPPGSIKEILILGRMEDVRVKGVDIAARAIGNARAQLSSGPGELRLQLRGVPDAKEAETLREKILRWADWPRLTVAAGSYSVDSVKLAQDLRRATLVLMPSRGEGYGLVGVEAIAAGAPVLISQCSGLAQHLQRVAPTFADRVIVPVEDREDIDTLRWGDAIARVLQNPEAAFANADSLARHMQTQATWEMAARAILDLIPGGGIGTPPRSPETPARRSRHTMPVPVVPRDKLLVLVCGGPRSDDAILDRLRADLATTAPHVFLWTGPDVPDDEAAERTLLPVDAVLVVLARSGLPDPARRQVEAALRRSYRSSSCGSIARLRFRMTWPPSRWWMSPNRRTGSG